MIDFVTGVFLTVRKTALCQERTSSIIAPLRLELPAPPALLPALDVPVQKTRQRFIGSSLCMQAGHPKLNKRVSDR